VIEIDPRLVERYVDELSQHGRHGETGVWRTVYSPEWVDAQAHVAGWCREAGLEVHTDAVGNLWGRLEGTEPGDAIVTGSHLDSMTPGGRFDGALGVIAAVIAVAALHRQAGRPRRSLEVVALCEEEASRFPNAAFWGSRAIGGQIPASDLVAVKDGDGITVAEAMRAVGLDPGRIGEAKRDDIGAFIELHIEQGPVLEAADLPVGIVTAITGLRHCVVEVIGRADHAGARPMHSRLDPMAAAAEMISGVIGAALELGHPAVTTVGKLGVEPNLTAAVPERVVFTIDARDPDPRRLRLLHERHDLWLEAVARRRGVRIEREVAFDHDPCICAPRLVDTLTRAADARDVPAMRLHSGAGHDSQRMADMTEVAMVFVRSIDGRSHTPAELTTPEDAAAGIGVLASALHELAY
jgi:allantoate deiminase